MNFTTHLYSVQSQRYREEHLTFLWGHRNHTLVFQGWSLHEFLPQQGNCIHSPDFISPLGTRILLHSLLWLGKVIGLGYHLEEDGVAPSPGHRWISVQFSHSVVSDSLQPHGLQHMRPPCPSPTPGAFSNSCPSSRWCHPSISSSFVPFSSCLQSFPASGSFPRSQFFTSGGQSLEFQLQHQSFQWTPRTDLLWDGLVASPCSPRDSQESSPAPQFKSINSLALSFPYSPTLTSVHDYWKNHSFE